MTIENAIEIVLALARTHINSFNLSPTDQELADVQNDACDILEDFSKCKDMSIDSYEEMKHEM